MVAAGQMHLSSSTVWRRPMATRTLFALARLEERSKRIEAALRPAHVLTAALADDLRETRAVVGEVAADLAVFRRIAADGDLPELVTLAERELTSRGLSTLGDTIGGLV